jgi:8-hydroxy-5-deazaflavin:NADPH oxidoreductase
MNIAILGGTGKEGSGLGARWALAGHSIVIGSRDPERARTKAAEMRDLTQKLPIVGHGNAEAAALGDVIVVALPASGLDTTLPEVREGCRGKVVVSTVVPMTFRGGRLFTPPPQGSAAEQVQELLPESRVVAAFHHIAAHELSDLEHDIDCDLLSCGADAEAKAVVVKLAASMGLRSIDVGPLTNAGPVEGVTAILATVNRRYKVLDAGIRITGIP